MCEREREALIDISFKIAHDISTIPASRPLGLAGLIVSELHDENDDDEEVQDSIVTSSCTCSCWCWWSFEIDHMAQCDLEEAQRCEKISNNSSFGIIDIADSSTSDRIIVIVDTDCFIHDGAYR